MTETKKVEAKEAEAKIPTKTETKKSLLDIISKTDHLQRLTTSQLVKNVDKGEIDGCEYALFYDLNEKRMTYVFDNKGNVRAGSIPLAALPQELDRDGLTHSEAKEIQISETTKSALKLMESEIGSN